LPQNVTKNIKNFRGKRFEWFMRFITLLLGVFLLLGQSVLAQDNLVVEIQEVVISDNLLKDYSQTQKTEKLTDSIIKRSSSFLTSVLNYNSLIYFKENGDGGASSASFR